MTMNEKPKVKCSSPKRKRDSRAVRRMLAEPKRVLRDIYPIWKASKGRLFGMFDKIFREE